MTQSVPSSTALATSVHSARVGRGFLIMDSSICVAVMTGFPEEGKVDRKEGGREAGGEGRGVRKETKTRTERPREGRREGKREGKGYVGVPRMLALLIIIFCAKKTFSGGISIPRSPRATIIPSVLVRISS